ncbi:MAG: PAS domain-containing protein [Bacteroidales bacterium]|nr:PAS domain-containing protein [Bacteroidales bacterium]
MRILLCTILFLTAFVNYCRGQFEYVYSNIRCEEEQRITAPLNAAGNKDKHLWGKTLMDAEKVLSRENNLEKVAGSLARIYQLYDIINNEDGKNRCLEKINRLAETSGNLNIYLRAQIMQAYSQIQHHRFDLAIAIYQKAVKYLETRKAYKQLAEIHYILGVTYDYAHNEVLSIRNLLKAVSIVKNDYTKDTLLTGEVYLHTAITYLNDGDFGKADEYILDAMTIFKNGQNSFNKQYRNNLNTSLIVSADIKRATKQYDEAITLYEEGIDGFRNSGLDSSEFTSYKYLSDGYNGLGITYQKNKIYDKAIKNMLMSFEIRKKLGIKSKIADSYITIAEYYTTISKPDSAYVNFVNGFNAAFDIRNVTLLHQASQGLADYYHKKRDYEKAYKYLEIANNYYQDIIDMKKSKEVAWEEMDFIFAQERDYAKKIKEEQDATIRRDKIIIHLAVTFCIISVLMSAVIILLFYKRKKKNQKLREQRDKLEQRSEQLQRQQDEITEKNQELRATTEMLEATNKELRILSTVAAATVNAIFITDINGNFTWFNDSFSRYSDIPFEELHTNPVLSGALMPQVAKDAYKKVLETKQSADFVMNMKLFAPEKGDVWMQTTVTPVFDQNNEISMMILVCSDITELRLLSAVASMTSNSIFITDAKGDFIWFNDAFAHDTHISFDELHTHPALKASAMPPETKKVYDTLVATKEPQTYTAKITHVKDLSMWVQTAVTPILDDNGEISMIVWVNTDITELRATTKMLEERNNELQMLSAVAASTGNSIYITTKEGEFIWFNDAFSRETHIPKDQIHTHPALKASAMTPETREIYLKVLATKETQSYTAEMKHLVGKPFWVQSYVTPVLDDNGEIMMIVWVSTNITELHHAYEKIEEQNKEINASITYARRIQDAVQPMKIFSDEILGDHFIINMPRNIVSGDFHWVGYKNGLAVFTVADCTGHGVPGAFISMLGQVMFNQTINKLNDLNPASILNMVRNGIIHQLHQRDKADTSSDSIDASLFVYDRHNCIIDFAGAYSHAYLLRFGTPDEEIKEICKNTGCKIFTNDENDAYLIRLKSNHMTLGIDRCYTIPFTSIKFKVNHGDIAYATTDGYPDQFGGEKQKRFYVANFEKVLLKYCHLTMEEQRKELERTFLEWKGDYEQTDDVHVLGIVL